MSYKELVLDARANGTATEQHMYKSIDRIDALLATLHHSHPEIYWQFLRDTYIDFYGPHYNQEYADYDLSLVRFTDRDGKEHMGPHWSFKQIRDMLASRHYPEGTTESDIYVACNVLYADLCRTLSDQNILDIAYTFFFCDEDAPEGKVWHYMNAMRQR